MSTFTLKTQHVNSNRLLGDVCSFVSSIITDFNIIWSNDSQRAAILEIIDEHLQDLANDNKLEQWDVVCDKRNNTRQDITNKITHLYVEYKQRNCFNVTRLYYTIN